jgi:hypothetical protein
MARDAVFGPLDDADNNGNGSLEEAVMKLLATLVAGMAVGLAAGLCAGGDGRAGEQGRKPAEAFKEWGDYFVGGVWTTTNARGKTEAMRCEWILDKSFIRLTWKIGDESREEIHGIDPATGKWTIAGFDSKGRVYQGVGGSEKSGAWNYRSSGQGQDGPMSWKSQDVRVGPDEERYEIEEQIIGGKKLAPEVQIWKRKR